ncbi:MAG: MFS transporter [Gammaproteobacteria bacterium]|nr:MFS transporter [Gammaproteobacteria bacterium]
MNQRPENDEYQAMSSQSGQANMNNRSDNVHQTLEEIPQTGIFFRFLGLHTLLYGIFPFYIPVYMWTQGVTLSGISWFIAVSGAGFMLGLWTWDRLRGRISLVSMFALSLVLELFLLVVILILKGSGIMMIVTTGFAYGFYNCFYWTTQRAMFYSLINLHNSGRKYGNLQIFVGALLQVGIVIGGYILDMYTYHHMLIISALISVVGLLLLVPSRPEYPKALTEQSRVSIPEVLKFKDQHKSRLMFVTDATFLFAESFFWIITLFMLVHESFFNLGIVVLSLAVAFGFVFYVLKNVIDRISTRRLFQIAVVLYALSWGLRSYINEPMSLASLYLMMIVITFLTAFFRLTLNKRFYDIAQHDLGNAYLILKSYFTQVATLGIFALIAWFFMLAGDQVELLKYTYWSLAVCTFLYLPYERRIRSQSSG